MANIHPLSKQIKEYFMKDNGSSFIKRIGALMEIEEIEVFPDEPDDEEVFAAFKGDGAPCISFSNGIAWFEYDLNDYALNIPFNYELHPTASGNPWLRQYVKEKTLFDGFSIYSGYETKGMEQLFDDIMDLAKKMKEKRVHLDYIDHWKWKMLGYYPAIFEKCRVSIVSGEVIVCSKKWNEKYLKSPKIKTVTIRI
ncbi:MAG: hypothetical protein FWD58_01250 [Firmicutes bacterium]|nr:hypothetical protein [Bacillota bacterium]